MRNTRTVLFPVILCLFYIGVSVADDTQPGPADLESVIRESVNLPGVTQSWARIYNGVGNNLDQARAVAVDAAGNVYVTGASETAALGSGYLTIKYGASGKRLWAVRFKGTGSVNRANAIALDSGGNVFVTGVITSSAGNHIHEPTDCVTIKYDANGKEVWVARFSRADGFPEGKALSVDAAGSVYVTGGCGTAGLGSWADYFTVKYDKTGAQLWARYYDGKTKSFPGGDDHANAIAVDGSGNVYVTGASEGSGFVPNYLTIKYDKSGTLIWVKRFSARHGEATAIALDSTGSVYVTGGADGPDYSADCVTVKYNASGVLLWARYHNGTAKGDDQANGIALDRAGNVYIAGSSEGSIGSSDYLTVKYDSAGTKLWEAAYHGTGNGKDEARAIALDGGGNVYITGYSTGSGTSDDYATVKYNTNGSQLWAKRYNGTGNGADHANAIAVDSAGNVCVAGYSEGSNGVEDYGTLKYDTNGSQLWAKRYNGTGNGFDHAHAIAADSSGNSYVTGTALGSDGSYDYVTVKYSASGAKLWAAQYNGTGNGDDCAVDIAVDGNGNAYVTGYSRGSGTYYDYATVKYDANGNQLWAKRYNGKHNENDQAFAIAVDGSGNAYVAGYSSGGFGTTYEDYATIKYDANGNQLWVRRYNGKDNGWDRAVAIAVDPSRNVYVTGTSGENTDFVTIKYSPTGSPVWIRKYAGDGPSAFSGPRSIVVDGSGNVYVAGSHNTDYVTLKYSKAGAQLWARYYNGTGNGWDFASAAAADAAGNVYITGMSMGSDFDCVTVKYNSSGSQLWANRYLGTDTSGSSGTAISVDASGNVYVAGDAVEGGPGNRGRSYFLTLKYNTGGSELWSTTRYSGTDNYETRGACGIVLDGNGNCFVTGSADTRGTGDDYMTIKYSFQNP